MSLSSPLFQSPRRVFSAAAALRVVLLFYGLYQDAHSPVKYTDIDYMVFTDAARFVSRGHSPYARDTYRYTPLLAWMLLPTAWRGLGPLLFSFGKVLFAVADLVAGWLLVRVLRSEYGMSEARALKYASLWLLNPMVATISTRGSSEGLLGVMVMALLWAITQRRIALAGVLLGLGVHFKIYPFIYGPSMLWWLDRSRTRTSNSLVEKITALVTPSRIALTLTALSTFSALNISMYMLYGLPFMQHTYLHHLTRIDHRHNFSPYNTLLYLSAARQQHGGIHFESLAFVPQLFLSAVAIPLVLARKNLPGTMLAQTFAFVAFNKVCTSQYFLWYLIFLPLYLPSSSFLKRPIKGISAALLWVLAQALWLHQAFRLEFLGITSFLPGLWLASLIFFAANVWILGVIVADVGGINNDSGPSSSSKKSATAAATATGGSGFSEQKLRVVAEYMKEVEEMQESS